MCIIDRDIKLSLLEDKEENYKLLEKWCKQKEIYNSFEQRELTYDEIVNKYKKRCNIESKTPVYLIYYKDEKVGIIQYTLKENVFDIDIFIGEIKYHNKGIGSKAIKLFTNYLINEKGAKELTLIPLNDNLKAINCYKKCGYKIIKEFRALNTIKEEKEYVLMKYIYEDV